MTPDPEARIAELEAENAALREQVKLLAARVEDVLQFGTGEDRQIEDAVSSCNPCERGLFCI